MIQNDSIKECFVLEFNFASLKRSDLARWHIHTFDEMIISNITALLRQSELSPWLVIGIYETHMEANKRALELDKILDRKR